MNHDTQTIQQEGREGPHGSETQGNGGELEKGEGVSSPQEREEWRQVIGYEGLYEVSSTGIVRSVDREQPHGGSGTTRALRGRVIRGWINSKGYRIVSMSRLGVVSKRPVHRIVCDAFYVGSESRECTNHKDGDKLNNRADNIEPATYSENNFHAYRTGLKSRTGLIGERNGSSKLTAALVGEIRARSKSGEKGAAIARSLGVSKTTISRVISGRNWKQT